MSRFFVAILVFAAAPAIAGKYNPTLSIGDIAPAWKELPAVDGEPHGTTDEKDAKVLIVAFTCNTCPYAIDHETRLVALAKQFEGRPVRLVAINCNAGDGDSLDAMKARAKEKGFNFPYMKDDSGTIGKAFGASRTPEFVVLGPDRNVTYLGALDDDPKGKNVKRRYVEEAIHAALDGKPPEIAETPPIGCGVKYPRERRKKATAE